MKLVQKILLKLPTTVFNKVLLRKVIIWLEKENLDYQENTLDETAIVTQLNKNSFLESKIPHSYVTFKSGWIILKRDKCTETHPLIIDFYSSMYDFSLAIYT